MQIIWQNFNITNFKRLSRKNLSEFVVFDFVKDQLDVFLGKYISDKKELWHICKLVFVLSHGQSYVEHGFSVKELTDTNMKEKSIFAQRLIL